MPAWTKGLGNGAIGREKLLCLAWRFEPLPAPLALAGGVMRVLRAVMEIAVLTMFYSRQNLAFSSTVALQLIGDDHARSVRQSLEEFAEELLRGPLIPMPLA
jgi:hypothetical protein